MKFVMSSTHEELRDLLSIRPTNLEQTYAMNNVVSNAHQEFNQMCFGTINPSKITTKRRHSFLSLNNKKRQYHCEKKSRKDQPQFQRAGRVRANKKRMEDQLEISSRRQNIVEQPSPAHNIGMDI